MTTIIAHAEVGSPAVHRHFKTFMYSTDAAAGLGGSISLWCCQNM